MVLAPALEALTGTTSLVRFNGSFGGTSEWRGPPSDDIDKQWENISDRKLLYFCDFSSLLKDIK